VEKRRTKDGQKESGERVVSPPPINIFVRAPPTATVVVVVVVVAFASVFELCRLFFATPTTSQPSTARDGRLYQLSQFLSSGAHNNNVAPPATVNPWPPTPPRTFSAIGHRRRAARYTTTTTATAINFATLSRAQFSSRSFPKELVNPRALRGFSVHQFYRPDRR